MVELNHRERTIKVKIVYYGPALGGKTTNLQILHQHATAGRRGELVSINSAQDRTILFDLLPLKTPGFRGFDLKLQILAVPGQAMYSATRRLVLKGADAVVFVANSAADRWEENIQSFREMTQNLITHQLDPAALPLVLQYNKRDLPDVMPLDFMDRALNARKVESIPAVAVRGEGVLESFSAILSRTMKDLSSRYQIVDRGKAVPEWTQHTVLDLFGVSSLQEPPAADAVETPTRPPAAPAPPPPTPPPTNMTVPMIMPLAEPPAPPPPAPVVEPPARRPVRVALPEEAVKRAGITPDARANETLVDSYAQASSQLTTALSEMREERDDARRRLEDLQHALGAGYQILTGQSSSATLRAVLARLAVAGRATSASFVVQEGGALNAVALRDTPQDPLLSRAPGIRHLQGKMLVELEPRLHLAADSLDLAEALDAAIPSLAAAASVPVRTPRGLQGLALLYYSHDAVLPGPELLTHLGWISRAIGAPLELARALDTVREAERTLQLALAGTASVRGLEEVVTFLLLLRDRLGGVRRRADTPSWLVEELTRLSPTLAYALAMGRSLLGLNRGEIQRERVSLDDVLEEQRSQGVAVHIGPGVGAISGDLMLLRLALASVTDLARAGGGQDRLEVRVVGDGGRVRVSVPTAKRGDDAALGFARRIAELHGGGLTVETDAAGGLRYTLTLPAA
jgi:hypothetical protein